MKEIWNRLRLKIIFFRELKLILTKEPGNSDEQKWKKKKLIKKKRKKKREKKKRCTCDRGIQ